MDFIVGHSYVLLFWYKRTKAKSFQTVPVTYLERAIMNGSHSARAGLANISQQ